MKKMTCLFLFSAACLVATAQTANQQPPNAWQTLYRASATKLFDLVHTKIDVSFNYQKKQMPGKVWLTLKPHYYAQDSLVLDAKGMLINRVAIVKNKVMKNLAFTYPDTLQLHIQLDKSYQPADTLMVYIEYVARPDDMTFKGSAAIRNAKGLYFINPDGKDTTKPIQIWTQGETEATSVWLPIIDKTNQKTTEEITMTVPAKYATLSNGLLVSSTPNKDGTRTDYWKMDLPHSPYLFFMAVGDFAIIKDKYKNIAVDYYVEPKYAAVAKKIFGLTPEMIGFFSKLLGVEYPWAKYAQIVGRDYVSGAMENTTSTLHGAAAYQKSRALADANRWETTIAHELFHQWFGDYVTAESWSNLTLNESFANYSQTLWLAYKYGKDAGDEENENDMQKYLRGRGNADKNLVRYFYNDKENMFDGVSYEKGGRILHMLRNYMGDSAFFKGLTLYLNTNKFKNGEVAQLRLAMEEITGRDLNWFFNQWYFGTGHPDVEISYGWNDATMQQSVIINQRQKGQLFQFPLAIDVYEGNKKTRHLVWVADTIETFILPATSQPTLVNVDADKIMLWKKTDHKTNAQYAYQYANAPLYLDRKEALDYLTEHFDSSNLITQTMSLALEDKYHSLRQIALRFWKAHVAMMSSANEASIYATAQKLYNNPTRAIAIDVLAKKNNPAYTAFYKKTVTDSSYSVAGAALEALINADITAAMAVENELKKDADGRLKNSLTIITYYKKDESEADSIAAEYKRMNSLEKATNQKAICYYLLKIKDAAKFKKIAGPMVENYTRPGPDFGGIKTAALESINWLIEKKETQLKTDINNTDLQEQIKYMKDKLNNK